MYFNHKIKSYVGLILYFSTFNKLTLVELSMNSPKDRRPPYFCRFDISVRQIYTVSENLKMAENLQIRQNNLKRNLLFATNSEFLFHFLYILFQLILSIYKFGLSVCLFVCIQ